MSRRMQRRLEWADMVREAAIIDVVYFHSTLFLGDVGIDQTLGRAKSLFELFPLPASFLIAGIFSARAVLNDNFTTLFTRRILPILYVYVVWSALRFVMFAAFPMLPVRDTDIPPADPMSLVLLPVLPQAFTGSCMRLRCSPHSPGSPGAYRAWWSSRSGR